MQSNYYSLEIMPEVYEDLIDFYYFANLALQQLRIFLLENPYGNQGLADLLTNGEYFAEKINDWLSESRYENRDCHQTMVKNFKLGSKSWQNQKYN